MKNLISHDESSFNECALKNFHERPKFPLTFNFKNKQKIIFCSISLTKELKKRVYPFKIFLNKNPPIIKLKTIQLEKSTHFKRKNSKFCREETDDSLTFKNERTKSKKRNIPNPRK